MGLRDLFKSKPKQPNYEEMIKSSDWVEREEAAAMITDENILKDVFLNDKNLDVRRAAIFNPNLQDEEFFQQIVLGGKEKLVVEKRASDGENAGFIPLIYAMLRCEDKEFVKQVCENNTSGVGHIAEKMLKGQRMYINGEYITVTV